MMKVSASIVIYHTDPNQLDLVVRCVCKSNVKKVYLLDNSEVGLPVKVITTLPEKIEYIFGHGNIGYGRAHNIALTRAIENSVDYHIILNPDISFQEGTLEKVVSFMDSHSDVGSCMPNVIYPDGRLQYLCKLIPTPLDMFGRRLLPRTLMKRRNYMFEMRETGYNQTRDIPLLSGCFMFLRMSVIKEVGMFDERFFMYFEDYDLTRRIHKISKTVFYPEATIVHDHAHSHRGNWKLLLISIRSAILYFNKWGWLFDKERRLINQKAFSEYCIIR